MTSMDLFKNAWACHTAKASLQKSAIAFCQNCSDSENWKEIKQYTEGNKILGPVIFLLVSRSPKTYRPRRWSSNGQLLVLLSQTSAANDPLSANQAPQSKPLGLLKGHPRAGGPVGSGTWQGLASSPLTSTSDRAQTATNWWWCICRRAYASNYNNLWQLLIY